MTTKKLGLDGKAYVSLTTHMATSPVWVEIDLVQNVEMEDSKAEATVRDRSSDYVKSGAGKREITYTLTCTYDASDTTVELLRDAYDAGTLLAFAIMDGDITTSGEIGVYFDGEISSGPKGEDLEEFDDIVFKIRPSAKSTVEPTRVLIA